MKNSSLGISLSLLLLAAAGLLTGCHTSVNSVERARPLTPRDYVDEKRFITDKSLNRQVSLVGVNQSVGPGGLLRVQVEVLNTTRSQHVFSYRFEWLDEGGILIDTPASTFVTRPIEGGESLFLTGVAPNDRAKDFRLKLIKDLR